MLDATSTNAGRRINWLNVSTVVSAAILIGAEVFGAAFAGSWAIANLFGLDPMFRYALDAIFVGCGAIVMYKFIRAGMRIEPFVIRS